MKFVSGFITLFIFFQSSTAQNAMVLKDCSAKLENNFLTIENSKIARTYKWNNGNITTINFIDKENGKIWQTDTNNPDLAFPGQNEVASNATFSPKIIAATSISPAYLVIEITYLLDKLAVKRIFRIYPNTPAIACDLYYRGVSNNNWLQTDTKLADMINLEKVTPANAKVNAPVIEKIELPGKHWKLKAVEFSDISDRFNTLVFNVDALSYRRNYYRGNILFATDNTSNNGVFILKESPTSNVQLAYPGSDFLTEFGTLRVIGAGLSATDLDSIEWKRGYGFVIGVYKGDENNACLALRQYQKNIRLHNPERDEMVLMNTWGDRGEDKRINEKFSLAELDAAKKLGISHFQLDAGWQKGHYGHSFITNGSLINIWGEKDYWAPHPDRFPNGLDAVVKKGKELGIKICLWFNPSKDDDNANWEKDADVLIGMYRNYDIRTFKIDGVNLPTKTAEINFRKFLDKVEVATENNVVFNLDVTAGRRGGYHYFNEYGNIFLENRYTDWQNYYPYTTLRNVWMLSKYIPPQNLQIEFLNKWRNIDKYGGDPFAPANYSFDYLFAITMAAQPLAWFEGANLPNKAFKTLSPIIKKYREIQVDFHSGNIFPIGEEPSGKSWTGFQSLHANKGYFLIFREATGSAKAVIKTWLPSGKMVKCTSVFENAKTFTTTVGIGGTVQFNLPKENSYALYKYTLN